MRLPLLLLPLLLTGCAVAADAPVLEDTEAYIDRELLVAVEGDDTVSLALEREHGLVLLDRNERVGVSLLGFDEGRTVKQVASLLDEDHRVRFAEPNHLVRSTGAASDPYAAYQWNLDAIAAPDAWDYGRADGVVVAVLDTGVKGGGPDGISNLLSGYDFYYGDSDPSDRDGHGTFVAGTIGQRTDNGVGVAGIAPGASILPIKVLGDDGYGDINAIANGITWAADQGASVINMSLGSSASSQTLKAACDYAYGKGVVLVAATGNEFASSVSYPGAYDTVIAVGATRFDNTRAAYSNTGSAIDLVAPGGDLSRDDNGDGYADGVLQETLVDGSWTYTFWEGTSMASPHVAAVAALVVAQGVTDPGEVYEVLTASATDVGSNGWDSSTGYGLVDAQAAVLLAREGLSTSPSEPEDSESEGEDTEDTGPDTTAPTISSVGGTTDGDRFTIQWTTNEPADTWLNFDTYGLVGDGNLVTSHSLTLRGSSGATYTFRLQSADAAGNVATSGLYSISL
jgi:serine protease